MGLKWLLFPTKPPSHRIQNTQLVKDGWQIQNQGRSHFPHDFWSLHIWVSYLSSRRRISCSSNGHIAPPPPTPPDYVDSRALNGYHNLSITSNLPQTCVFLVLVLEATPNYIPLQYKCLRKESKWIRDVYLTIRIGPMFQVSTFECQQRTLGGTVNIIAYPFFTYATS
jgi:hypothetical protein